MITRHVVLITYGEPPTPAFASQFRYSWRILRGLTRSVADIPPLVLPLIAVTRARKRNRLWRAERYASPLEPITHVQARGLEAALIRQAPPISWRVHVAYEFRDPLLGRMLDRLPRRDPVDILPMYVADSAFTHAIARAALMRWSGRSTRPRAPIQVLPPMAEEHLADLSARHVLREIRSRRIEPKEWALVLAAHGTLLEPPRPMETGREATERIARAIARRLAGEFGVIDQGWLNHTFGGRWTEPPIEVVLQRVAKAGYRRVVYYPFGFSADNAESELEGRIALRSHAWLEAAHLPCLNDSSEFVDALVGEVTRAAGFDRTPQASARAPGGVESTGWRERAAHPRLLDSEKA